MSSENSPYQPTFKPTIEILQPHSSLRYVARLLKVLAVILMLLLVAEVAIGLYDRGTEAVPVLLVEGARLIVFAGLLWGGGDMALMFIESNHDLRAARVLLWQLNVLQKMELDKQGVEVELINTEDPTFPT